MFGVQFHYHAGKNNDPTGSVIANSSSSAIYPWSSINIPYIF